MTVQPEDADGPADEPPDGPATVVDAAAVQLYRSQVVRATNVRNRLDTVRNWAVFAVGGVLSFALSFPTTVGAPLLLGMVLVAVFLLQDAALYRRFLLYESRVELLERFYFAALLGDQAVERDVRTTGLAETLRAPRDVVPFRSATAERLVPFYLSLLVVLLVAWVARLIVFGSPGVGPFEAATYGTLPGTLVVAVVGLFYGGLVLLAVLPRADWRRELVAGDD